MYDNDETAVARIFYPPPVRHTSAWSCLLWWERRRLTYNVAVGSAGLLTLSAFALASLWPALHMSILEMLPGVLVFGFLANVCYTAGWLVEGLMRLLWGQRAPVAGPLLFRQGVIFSMGVALLPLILLAIVSAVQLGMLIFG